MKNPFRKIKIYEKFQARDSGFVIVPEIRLTGKWLEKSGFTTGREILIQTTNNKITITII